MSKRDSSGKQFRPRKDEMGRGQGEGCRPGQKIAESDAKQAV